MRPIRSVFPRKGLPGSNGCSRRRSPTRPPRAFPTGPGATRWRSSRPRTKSMAASACGPCRPERMTRDLGDGFELDDSKERIDLVEVHRFLSDEAYWTL